MALYVNNSANVPFKAEYAALGERNLTIAASAADWMLFGFAGGMYDAETVETFAVLRGISIVLPALGAASESAAAPTATTKTYSRFG